MNFSECSAGSRDEHSLSACAAEGYGNDSVNDHGNGGETGARTSEVGELLDRESGEVPDSSLKGSSVVTGTRTTTTGSYYTAGTFSSGVLVDENEVIPVLPPGLDGNLAPLPRAELSKY